MKHCMLEDINKTNTRLMDQDNLEEVINEVYVIVAYQLQDTVDVEKRLESSHRRYKRVLDNH